MPPDSYAACEAGRAKLPKYQAQLVAFRVACAERDEALTLSGLPTCSWIEQLEREEPPPDAKMEKHVAYLERAEAHAKTCATCQARDQFVRDRFPNMPKPPMATWMRGFSAASTWIEARPEWMRPAFYGAAILAAMTSLRAVFVLPRALDEPRLLLLAFGAVVGASVAGAGGGLVYSFIGRPARRVPVAGPYLAGIVAVAGYVGCLLALLAVAGVRELTNGGMGTSLFTFGVVSIFFGLIVGHQWFRPTKMET
jgi:hypothetical protein